MNIAQLLREQASRLGDAVAIIESPRGAARRTTFAELDESVARAAGLLHNAGLGQGDIALFLSTMSTELYVALLAVLRTGGVAMFLDPSAGMRHVDQCCSIREPRAFIATPKAHLLRLASGGLRRIPTKFALGASVPGAMPFREWKRATPLQEIAPCDADTPALITFTSGSTGLPKAAVRTHRFLVSQHKVLERSLGLRAGQIDLTTLPVFLLANLASGVTSIIPDCDLRRPGFVKPGPLLRQIEEFSPESTAASPAFLEIIASAAVKSGKRLESFRRIFTGGAPVFPGLLDLLAEAAPQAEIVAVYGSTEAEPIAEISRDSISVEDRQAMTAGSGLLAGRPIPQIDLGVLRHQWGKPVGPFTSAEFQNACMPPAHPGEIVVHGDHVMRGYLDGRGDEETKFEVDGERWHRTGDSGYMDEQGRVWLLGRCAARIADRHGELYPFAVEVAALNSKGVRRAALLARDGRRLLALEPKPGAGAISEESLKRNLGWAKIDEFRILKRIPVDKRHNAKVDYPALKKILR